MRFIQVPEDIQIMGVDGKPWVNADDKVEKPWSFYHYLKTIVLPDPAMGSGYDAWNAYSVLNEAFKDESSGTWVTIDDAHWKLLCEIVNNPKGGLPTGLVMYQLIPFMDAILQARDKKPSKQKQ